MGYQTKRSKEQRIRAEALREADKFAKMTFFHLKKDDTILNRILRFFWLKKRQQL